MAVPLGSRPHRSIAAWICVRRVIGSEANLSTIASRLCGLLVMATSLASAPPSLATAAAADLASIYYAAPVRSVAFNWAGAYVGATFGYEWSSVDNNPTNPNGVAGGFEAGFNRQNGSPVYGGETRLGFSATANMFAPWQFSNPWFGTARGRASF